MKINLKKYGEEVLAYVTAAEPFIDRTTIAQLKAMQTSLESGRENTTAFDWNTRKPIRTRMSGHYDGRDRRMEPLVAELAFTASFEKLKTDRVDWLVTRMETHIRFLRDGDHDEPQLHVHFDKKNDGQLGPEMHVQVSEHFLQDMGRLRLGVPRMPVGMVLPTDCLDFLLSELFPADWPEAQVGAYRIENLRQAQLGRAESLARELNALWTGRKGRTPLSILQDCSLPALRLA